MPEVNTNAVKAGLCFGLLGLSGAALFIPVAEGAGDVKAMILMLTGIAVKSFFDGVQSDKRVEELKQAYDPKPPESFVNGRER